MRDVEVYGVEHCVAVPNDYDNDGIIDLAVYHFIDQDAKVSMLPNPTRSCQPIDNAANAEEDVCDSEADDNRHKYHDVLKLIHDGNPLCIRHCLHYKTTVVIQEEDKSKIFNSPVDICFGLLVVLFENTAMSNCFSRSTMKWLLNPTMYPG